MTALVMLISSIFTSLMSIVGWVAYWVIAPILLCLAWKILDTIFRYCRWRDARNWAPHVGCKRRKGKWFE